MTTFATTLARGISKEAPCRPIRSMLGITGSILATSEVVYPIWQWRYSSAQWLWYLGQPLEPVNSQQRLEGHCHSFKDYTPSLIITPSNFDYEGAKAINPCRAECRGSVAWNRQVRGQPLEEPSAVHVICSMDNWWNLTASLQRSILFFIACVFWRMHAHDLCVLLGGISLPACIAISTYKSYQADTFLADFRICVGAEEELLEVTMDYVCFKVVSTRSLQEVYCAASCKQVPC